MTNFEHCFSTRKFLLMEGALGERLKREYGIFPDEAIALAAHVYNDAARMGLKELYIQYITIAREANLPLMITSPTRRANRERAQQSSFADRNIINDNVAFLKSIRQEHDMEIYVGGLMGCRGNAYTADEVLSIKDAHEFHSWQANQFAEAEVDFLYAGIMPALPEAIGMARAMEDTGLLYIISFMIRGNGRLLDGTAIHDAISAIDSATNRSPVCYMTNCVHPAVLMSALSQPFNCTAAVRSRFMGIQANTSPLPPEELDNSCDLKTSDSVSLAEDMMELRRSFGLKIFGGCCGTDNTHMKEIAFRLSDMTK